MYEYYYEIDHNWLFYIIAFALSFGIVLFLTPWARKVSVKLGAIDQPKARGLHKKPMPRLGGLAIFLGFMATMIATSFFVEEFRALQFVGFAVGGIIIAGLGMLDDIYNLRPYIKLFVQIAVALVVVFTGTRIDFIGWDMPAFFDYLTIPVTIIWIVGIINAVNFIDGVDGLAAGVTSIASVFLAILSIMTGSPMAVIFTITLAGSCLGFLPRNFSPADVIMGDTGSTFLGYVLAVSSIIGVYKGYALLSVVIVAFAMALPIMDTIFVFISRIIKGKSPMTADRGHFHHKLIDKAGFSHKKTVVVLYIASAIFGIIAILIALQDFRVLIIGLVLVLVLISLFYSYRKRVSNIKTSDDENENK